MSLDAKAIAGALLDALRRGLERTSVVTEQLETFEEFLTCFGWNVTVSEAELQSIREFMAVEAPLEAFGGISLKLEIGGGNQTELIADLATTAIALANSIRQWAGAGIAALPPPFDGSTTFWNDFPEDLLHQMVTMSLREEVPTLFHVLNIFGIIERQVVNPGGPPRMPFVRVRIRWDKLGQLVTDPLGLLHQSFKWGIGGQDFDHLKFVQSVGLLVDAAKLPGRLAPPTTEVLDIYYSAANPARSTVRELDIPFMLEFGDSFEDFAEVGLRVIPIPPARNPAGAPNGFALAPLVRGNVQGSLDPESQWKLILSGDTLIDGAFRLEVRPDGAGLVMNPGALALKTRLALQGRFTEPFVLIGAAGSHRIELEGVFVAVALQGNLNDPEVIVMAGTGEGSNAPRLRFILQMGQGDGFLTSVIGTEPQSLDLSGFLSLSSKHGLGISGSIGLQIQIPLHLKLGPIEIASLQIGTAPGATGGLDIPLGITIGAMLGPLTAVVENIGVKMKLTPKPAGQPAGLLGNLDVDWDFKPPNGVGLAIDAGVVKGGGYLYLDFEKEEYAGALELVFSGWITLKAIGLITTRMPDGSKGFSLLLIITAEFGTGIQLGYGFVLIGVGGLLGLNRTMKLQPLVDGVRTGAVQSVMFPRDVIANAPRIISDLRTFFPPAEGIFLIGPMAKVGWGTPALITLSLGIIIEIPGNIAILGVLALILPDAKAPILVLQVNFVGAIEFDKSRAYFFAAIYDSRILFMTIEGEMGLLIAWGQDANFVVSVGGFHPSFTPPPLPFPSPERISISILNESYGRIQATTYFAVTSNTVQFGARADLYFGFSEFKIEGYIGFDALFQFNPFYFIIEISAGASLKVFGIGLFSIGLKFSLEGPTPWRAKGYGKISFLFFSFKASFDETWGDAQDTTLPPVEVFPLLAAEFAKIENWTALVPESNNLLVSLRPLPAGTPASLVLHPIGTLTVTQRAVPLDITIDKVGTQKPSDANNFSLGVTAGLQKAGDTSESFAIAQYQNVKDAISRPAFQPMHGGLALTAADQGFETGRVTERPVRYETIVIDTNFRRYTAGVKVLIGRLFELFLGGNAVARSTLSYKSKSQLQPFSDGVTVTADRWAVASTRDNAVYKASAVFNSEAEAREFMNVEVTTDAGLADQVHVIPEFELSAR